ncbi:MAG: hypothetical protein NTU95_03265 [Methanothrix sp.]|nr:hypothetical protein [Methanothrix sp.]
MIRFHEKTFFGFSLGLRGFAPSREPLDLARSREGREAMIADLKHYPAMRFSSVLLLER